MRKYRGKNIKKVIIHRLPKDDVKKQIDSFELEYQKFIEELKAKKNEKKTQEDKPQILQSNR